MKRTALIYWTIKDLTRSSGGRYTSSWQAPWPRITWHRPWL